MKSTELALILKLRDEATAQWQKFTGQVEGGIGKLQSQFARFGGLITAAFSVAAFKGFVDEANEADRASARLGVALRNAGDTSDKTKQEMLDFAAALQKTTTFSDETVTNVQSLITAMTGLTGKAVQPLTIAALDLATGLGIDAESAAQLIAKTIEGKDALSRYGISVKGAANESEKIGIIIDQIRQKFGGFAEGEAKTAGGRMKILQNQISDLKEEFGGIINQVLGSLVPVMRAFISILQEAPTPLKAAILAVGGLTAAIIVLNAALLANPITWIILGIAGAVVLLAAAFGDFNSKAPETKKNIEEVSTAFELFHKNRPTTEDDKFWSNLGKNIPNATKAAGGSLADMKEHLSLLQKELDNLVPGTSTFAKKLIEIELAQKAISSATQKAVIDLQAMQATQVTFASASQEQEFKKAFDNLVRLQEFMKQSSALRRTLVMQNAATDLKATAMAQQESLKSFDEITKAFNEMTDKEIEDFRGKQEALSGFVSNLATVMGDSFTDMFAGTEGGMKAFIKRIMLMIIDLVQTALLAAAAMAPLKGILSFGITVAPDIGALIAGTAMLQLARAFVASFHTGSGGPVYFDAPASQNIPIMVRGGETFEVKTEAQQRSSGGGFTLIINGPIASKKAFKDIVQEGMRDLGITDVREYFRNNRAGIQEA